MHDSQKQRPAGLGEETAESISDAISTEQTTYAFIDAELRRMTGKGLPPMR